MRIQQYIIYLTNPQKVTDPDEQNLIRRRHIIFLCMNLFYIFSLSVDRWFIKEIPSIDHTVVVSILFFEISALLALSRRHHELVPLVLWVRLVLLGAFAHIILERAFISNLTNIIFTPFQSLYLSCSMNNYFVMVMVQLIQTAAQMEQNAYVDIGNLDNEKFFKIVVRSIMILQFTTALLLHKIIQTHDFYKRKSIKEETKRLTAENQKVFLLSFSHELRNLINNITGNVQICLFEDLSNKLKDHLKNAKLCGDILLYLINNILDHGKAEIGDLEINPQKVIIREKLTDIWNVCKTLIEKKNLKGRIYISDKVPSHLEVDIYRLSQIIFNLISNSCKFTESGFISISAKWINGANVITNNHFEPSPFDDDGVYNLKQNMSYISRTVSKACSEPSVRSRPHFPDRDIQRGVLRIDVCDSGSGIPSEKLSQLFTKFGQVSDDKSKRQIGTGLGLYIVKEICHKMKGDIKVFSKKGHGTAFVICIPLRTVNSSVAQNLKNVVIVSEDLIEMNKIENCVLKLNSKIIGTYTNLVEVKASLEQDKWRDNRIDIFLFNRSKEEKLNYKFDLKMLSMKYKMAKHVILTEDKHTKNEDGFHYILKVSLDNELPSYF